MPVRASPRAGAVARMPPAAALLLAVAVGAGALLAAGQRRGAGEDPAWQALQARGTLRVALDPAFPPFAFPDGSGELAGLDLLLAGELARRAGLELVLAPVAYDALYRALEAGGADLIMGGLPYEAERTQDVRYSPSYLMGGQVLVLPEGDATEQLEALDGQVLASQLGSEGDAQLRRRGWRLRHARLLHTWTEAEALQAVAEGRARAAVVDRLSALRLLPGHPGLVLAPQPVSEVPYVVAVPAGSRRLGQLVAETVLSLQARGELGRMQEEALRAWRELPPPPGG